MVVVVRVQPAAEMCVCVCVFVRAQAALGAMSCILCGWLQVAVKVLDGDAVLRRESATGLCLEALLGEQLKHPNVVATLAWAVVTGKVRLGTAAALIKAEKGRHVHLLIAFNIPTCCSDGVGGVCINGCWLLQDRIPRAQKLWGETLDSGRPSVAHTQEQQSEMDHQGMSRQSSDESWASEAYDDYGMASVMEGQTWLVMEFMDKGCLQVGSHAEHPWSCMNAQMDSLLCSCAALAGQASISAVLGHSCGKAAVNSCTPVCG